MKTSVFDSEYQLKSLASVLRGMRRALDANELAERLGVSKRTIMRKVKKGTIPFFKIGTLVRFDSAAISHPRRLLQRG